VIELLPLILPLLMLVLVLGFYWGRKHQRRMTEIDEPDEPQIFTDGGVRMETAALSASEIAEYSDEEISDHLDDCE
jgi:hypothetical protein